MPTLLISDMKAVAKAAIFIAAGTKIAISSG